MANTKIEWAEKVWNPVTGCTPISVGCANCYAKRMSKRLAGRCGYPATPHNFDVTIHPSRINEPIDWRKPSRIFVCSMGDLFHDEMVRPGTANRDFLADIFTTMERAYWHTFILLTKRPINAKSFLGDFGYPVYDNVWLGVTVENQAMANERIPILLEIPAAVRWLSVEPFIDWVDFNACKAWNPQYDDMFLDGINWVVCGAETGPGKRPMQLDWARMLCDQCYDAGVPFFFKKDSFGNGILDGIEYHEYPKGQKKALLDSLTQAERDMIMQAVDRAIEFYHDAVKLFEDIKKDFLDKQLSAKGQSNG